MKNIYCISGLGADHRIFARLQLQGYQLVPIKWDTPLATDTLPAYARRLCGQITDKAPIVIGLSLGGMLATEIARHIPDATVFILSSASRSSELGFNFPTIKWFAKMGMIPPVSLMPVKLLYLVGGRTPEERHLLYAMFTETDPFFIRWGIKAILLWKDAMKPANVFHIHGTADRLILPRFVQPDQWIKGGSHFMIFNRAAEVSDAISARLTFQ